jgi:hypothetical protein
MRKINLVVFALFVALTYGTSAVTSAFGDETAKFLSNGNEIGATEEIGVSGSGEVTLTVLVGGASAVTTDCSGIVDGTLLAGGIGLINEILTLAGTAISLTPLTGTGMNCTVLASLLGACGTVGELAEEWPLDLPWLIVVLLMATAPEFLVDVVSSGVGAPAGYTLCPNGKTNMCSGKTSAKVENEAGGIFGEVNEGAPIQSEKGTCTEGGNGAADWAGTGLTASNGGLTITVSE